MIAVLGFEPNQFDLDYTALVTAERWLPGYRGWVLAPMRLLTHPDYPVVDLRTGRPVQVTAVHNPTWEHAGFGIGRYAEPMVAPDDTPLISFRLALVREEVRVLGQALAWCTTFLNARTTGDQALARHPAVMQVHARLVAELFVLQSTDMREAIATSAGRRMLCHGVQSAGEQLIKLSGGRAMLAGHMVSVASLLATLNRMYLEDV
ncbi:MAG TPA: hypothetical protein VGJ60_09770 [Chloroflexota bacterium]|jgi:hypothetical protein